ncbi:CDC27 (predicted) [Pycnogonum litorale]
MIVQEPVQASIWHCLNHYAYNDAIFLSERLYAEVGSDEALFLLATCYYRSGKLACTYSTLHNKDLKNAQCRFLLAKCCYDLSKMSEAESVLTGSNIVTNKTAEDVGLEFSDSGSFAVQLLGQICSRTERHNKASDAFNRSLKLNPFLWSSYKSLCDLGMNRFFS